MKSKNLWALRRASVGVLAGLLTCLPAGNPRAQIIFGGSGGTAASVATSYTGQATAVSGLALGSSLTLVNSGQLYVAGDAREASSLGESVAGVFTTGVTHTSAVGQGNVAATESSVADITVTSGGVFGSSVIAADFVMARATTGCGAAGATSGAQVLVNGLTINGQAIAVTGAANQMVFVGGNMVIINEQFVTQSSFGSSVTVNALHIVTSAGANLVFGSASAGVTCGTQSGQAPPCGDFLTGGGWITGTPSGRKANFGVGGGIKNGAFWGHLNYVDHGNGMHVKATAVTGYTSDPNDPAHCRIICYDVTVNGAPGYKARVRACDYGEPGRDDVFEIRLYNTPPPPPCGTGPDTPIYTAGGDLGGNHPGGGNIQLHKCNGS